MYPAVAMCLVQRWAKEKVGSYESVERLVGRLTSIEAIVHLVGPGAHLDGTDEVGVYHSLFVEVGQQCRQVVADEMCS